MDGFVTKCLLGALMAAGTLCTALYAWASGAADDPHSFSRPDQVRVTDLRLGLSVDFESKVLQGEAKWTIERQPGAPADAPLILDIRDVTIDSVNRGTTTDGEALAYELGPVDPILGRALTIQVPDGVSSVRIVYRTSPGASALQWVEPSGTFGKEQPFLYTQSQAIHARSWVPCQDTPSVRFTFTALVVPPAGLRALMAAEEPRVDAGVLNQHPDRRGYLFRMDQPIPSYLLAMAVGDVKFRKLGERTGVWAEPAILDKAANEFVDTEKMLTAAEARFGPYRWGRYDILVLPPSFPYGGMENPRLTFATPTVLAGDRSQVALIAHEMAHSWSGNLVTNATWADFWLNEGFTVYLERRIVADVFGDRRAGMESVLGRRELADAIAKLDAHDQILNLDLKGRDPDDGVTPIAYEKGALFLETLAAKLGRERVREFLKNYFDHFAFQSITTAQFEEYLNKTMFADESPPIDLSTWLHQPGIPDDAATPTSDRFGEIETLAKRLSSGEMKANELKTHDWTTLEWLHFLRTMPSPLPLEMMSILDQTFHLTESGNAEIVCQWLEMAIKGGYHPADDRLADFLGSVGRRKFLIPLYTALIDSPKGRQRAAAIFEASKGGYHPIAVESVRRLIEKEDGG